MEPFGVFASYAIINQNFGPEPGAVAPESVMDVVCLIAIVGVLIIERQYQSVRVASVYN